MDSAQTRRRVKAARALAGISVGELAERIGQPGLGERTLRALEGEGGREIRPMELRAIADACELPYDFFTIDFRRLAGLSEASLDERLAVLESEVRRLAAERPAPPLPGELRHRVEGSQPSDENRPQDESPEEEDQSQGGEG